MKPPPQMFTPARIVAFTLVALLVAGLGVVRFGRGDDTPTVPKRAHAGQLTLSRADIRRKPDRARPTAGR